MNRPSFGPPREAGSSLLAALLMIVTLSAITGAFIVAVTSRTKTAYESASWRQASLAAESGANLALSEVRRVLPDLNRPVTDAWSGWTSSSGTLPTGRTIPPGVTLALQAPSLTYAGEGNTALTARLTLDAPAGMVDSGGNQWLRLRAQGTALIPGSRRVSPDKLDNRLRRLAYVRDAALGTLASRPQVTRTVEVIVRPVLPFRNAITCAGEIDIQGAYSCADSFDSRSGRTSTFGEYDSSKRRDFGAVCTNGSRFNFAGKIYGDVSSNDGEVQPSARITGTIDNNYFRPLPAISTPSWSGSTSNGSTLHVSGGTLASPDRRKIGGVSGQLRINGDGVVDIWVNGDLNGSITVDADIEARVFVDGNINVTEVNNCSRRAKNLIIYGMPPGPGVERTIDLALDRDVLAAVYAPGHKMRVSGSSDFMGSLVVQSLTAGASPRFHYDEALALGSGRVIDYRIASWVEEVY